MEKDDDKRLMQFTPAQLGSWIRRLGLSPPPDSSTDDMEILVREAMRQRRIKLERVVLAGARGTRARVDRRRYARTTVRRQFKTGRDRQLRIPKELLLWTYHNSPIADALVPNRRLEWVPILRRSRSETHALSLERFNFVDNPAETMQRLRDLVILEGTASRANIDFEDFECLDIGSYLVLGELWPALRGVFVGGKMHIPVQKALKAVGLGQQLQIGLKGATNTRDIWAYQIQRRRPRNTSTSPRMQLEPQRREHVADGLCDAIDKWLDRPEIEQELTIDGRAWLASLVGELLDNAERHSAPETKDGEWSTAAFMTRKVVDDQTMYSCHLGFLSVGATISESLGTAGPQIQQWLKQFLAHHEQSPVLPETLRTLFALQDGVTRDASAAADQRGGLGLQEVLHFVNELGGTTRPGCEPRVTIISGRACIQLRAPYFTGVTITEHGPRVLWCNRENSPNNPPDPAYVYDLPIPLAGTLISVAFTLDPEYLKLTLESDSENDQAR